MPDDVRERRRSDLARSEVLVPVRPGPEFRTRIVEVDEDEPVEADAVVEVGQERVRRTGRPKVDARAPCVRRVQAEPDATAGDADIAEGPGDRGELGDVGAEPEPAAGGVLEHEHRRVRRRGNAVERPCHAVREPTDSRCHAGSPMRSDVDVDVACPERRGTA